MSHRLRRLLLHARPLHRRQIARTEMRPSIDLSAPAAVSAFAASSAASTSPIASPTDATSAFDAASPRPSQPRASAARARSDASIVSGLSREPDEARRPVAPQRLGVLLPRLGHRAGPPKRVGEHALVYRYIFLSLISRQYCNPMAVRRQLLRFIAAKYMCSSPTGTSRLTALYA
jgi:hypothetical protein